MSRRKSSCLRDLLVEFVLQFRATRQSVRAGARENRHFRRTFGTFRKDEHPCVLLGVVETHYAERLSWPRHAGTSRPPLAIASSSLSNTPAPPFLPFSSRLSTSCHTPNDICSRRCV